MKLALTILTLIAIIGGSTSAQTTAEATRTNNMQIITSFPVQLSVAVAPDGNIYPSRGSDILIICVGHYVLVGEGGGTSGYSLASGSIEFRGDDDVIDAIPTNRLYDLLTWETVNEGTRLGLIPTSTDCTMPAHIKVYSESCVTRTRQGSLSTITPCTTDQLSTWEYAVCASR